MRRGEEWAGVEGVRGGVNIHVPPGVVVLGALRPVISGQA